MIFFFLHLLRSETENEVVEGVSSVSVERIHSFPASRGHGKKTAACGAHNGSRSQLVAGPGGRRTTAAMRAQHFASASTLAATSSAQSFATAAVAPSVGIVMLACRDICRLIVVTAATSGQAARVPRPSQATDTDPHLGRGMQHRRRRRRRRRRRLTAPKVASCKGCPYRAAGQPLPVPCVITQLPTIRGHSLKILARLGICRSYFLWRRDTGSF